MSDLHTDGNALAGLLGELLVPDATDIERRCPSCGAEHALGAHIAYAGAGSVLRCPTCSDVALRVCVADDALVFEWRGTFRIPRVA